MTKEDEAALNEYLNSIFIGRDDAGVDHTREIVPTRTWVAADEHYQKRIAELEAMIVRLHNTHPHDVSGMLIWWVDMFALMPKSAFGQSEGGADD